MEGIINLYNYIMIYLTAILCFVTSALLYIIFTHLDGARHVKQLRAVSTSEYIEWMRFLQRWTHSTELELIWTIIPTVILIAIAIPSFILLYALDEIVDTQCVVKVIGYQWYWRYEYPIYFQPNGYVYNASYLSFMLKEEELTENKYLRLLETDAPLILPHSVNVKIVVTAKDVLHSFAIPALGIKMDAVPGRLNQVTVHIFKPGVFYGQCSELCGVNHAYMPIVLHVISFSVYNYFIEEILLPKAEGFSEYVLATLEEFFLFEETNNPDLQEANLSQTNPEPFSLSFLFEETNNPELREIYLAQSNDENPS
jgi:cytochrome c oxidase subunit II